MHNVFRYISTEEEKPDIEDKMNWNNYQRLGIIHDFIDKLEYDYPSICTTGIIGKSLEGRDLKVK